MSEKAAAAYHPFTTAEDAQRSKTMSDTPSSTVAVAAARARAEAWQDATIMARAAEGAQALGTLPNALADCTAEAWGEVAALVVAPQPGDDFDWEVWSNDLASHMSEHRDGDEAQESIIASFVEEYGELDRNIHEQDGEYLGDGSDDIVRIEYYRADSSFRILGVAALSRRSDSGAERIAAERERQVVSEGYTAEHDRDHAEALSKAAQCYTGLALRQLRGDFSDSPSNVPYLWPWDGGYWRPSEDPARNLEKAGALQAAAIDVLPAPGWEENRG